jgi:hypothetical protein
MERILDGYPTLIDRALLYVPDYIRNNVYVHFFCGTDPYYAGLESGNDKTGDGRSFHSTAHHLPVEAQQSLPKSLRHSTIVLPEKACLYTPYDILHEYGHELHCILCKDSIYDMTTATDYATTNIYEAFAEAFAIWALGLDAPLYFQSRDNDHSDFAYMLSLDVASKVPAFAKVGKLPQKAREATDE